MAGLRLLVLVRRMSPVVCRKLAMDLIERLRGLDFWMDGRWNHPTVADEAADEIERLRAALKIARQWMPVNPLPNTGAVEDCKIVDEAIGNA